MALINKITKETRNARLHNEVEATYNLVNKNGETYIQINTFGSDDRAIKGKVSQSIQFSQDVIKEIGQILSKSKDQ
jgi:PBP1b-binding outer membrane lipoprotein LpoB